MKPFYHERGDAKPITRKYRKPCNIPTLCDENGGCMRHAKIGAWTRDGELSKSWHFLGTLNSRGRIILGAQMGP